MDGKGTVRDDGRTCPSLRIQEKFQLRKALWSDI